MLEAAVFVFVVTALGLLVQERLKVPVPMTVIGMVLASKSIGVDFVRLSDGEYDHLLMMLLPLLIMADALHLRLKQLKECASSLFYVAFIGVILAVAVCSLLAPFILSEYAISLPAYVALFCMLMATDPIAVAAVFGNFKLPHKLKILAEGESLFNDATGLIFFGLALSFMAATEPASMTETLGHSAMVIVGALIGGLICGFAGLYAMSLSRSPVIETAIMLATGTGAFLMAEHFHWSGILATIVAVLVANETIVGRIDQDQKIIETQQHKKPNAFMAGLNRYREAVQDKENHEMILQNVSILATFALTILFISMGDLISIERIQRYWAEILVVFAMTLVVRAMVTGGLSLIGGRLPATQAVPMHWWAILSASGVKGGISILMLHMLPQGFEFQELFEAVVVGNILLTTYGLPVAIMVLIKLNQPQLERELAQEHQNH